MASISRIFRGALVACVIVIAVCIVKRVVMPKQWWEVDTPRLNRLATDRIIRSRQVKIDRVEFERVSQCTADRRVVLQMATAFQLVGERERWLPATAAYFKVTLIGEEQTTSFAVYEDWVLLYDRAGGWAERIRITPGFMRVLEAACPQKDQAAEPPSEDAGPSDRK